MGEVEIGTIIADVGIIGVLAWYLWYKTSTADPRERALMREEFRELNNRNNEAHSKCEASLIELQRESRAQLEQMVKEFRKQISDERLATMRNFESLIETLIRRTVDGSGDH